MSERMCEATSKQGTVAVDIESSSDDGIEGTTGTEFKQRPTVAVDIESSSDDGVEGTAGTEFKQRPSCFPLAVLLLPWCNGPGLAEEG